MGEKTGDPVKNLTPVTATDIPPDCKDNTKADNSDIESQTQPASETSKDGYHAPYTLQWLPPMTIAGVLGFLGNNSANRDPQMRLSLRVLIPVSVICGLNILCRLAIWSENFMAMRVQPAGVYVTVNRYMPFWGDG